MDTVALSAAARSTDVTAKKLRESDLVPCVLYGNNVENTLLQCVEIDLRRAYRQAGESTVIELDANGKKVPVLFHTYTLDPITDKFSHVDFYAVDMNKEVEANVPLKFEGESPAVKNLGAILVTPVDHVTVKALPKDLPHELIADLTKLEDLQSTLTVSDLAPETGVTILTDADTVLATVQEKRKEEPAEVAPAEEATAEGETKSTEGEATKKEEGK